LTLTFLIAVSEQPAKPIMVMAMKPNPNRKW